MAFNLILWSLFFFQIGAQLAPNGTVKVIGTKDIPVAQQTYDWGLDYRCRLLGHGSVILQDGNDQILVFDSGMAKYKFSWDGNPVEVLDLNGWTVTVNLSKRFNTQDFGVVSQTKKPVGVPVTNKFGMWTDRNQKSIYVQGGFFYGAPGWNESEYFVPNGNIPPYSIWRFDLSSKQWTNVTGLGNEKGAFRRALGGAGVSVTSLNQSFYVGGIVTSRSDPTTPAGYYTPLSGMLIYEHESGNLSNVTYGSDDEQGYGYWHGSLNYMALGNGTGFLISLMGEKEPVGTIRQDNPGVDDETGMPVTFDSVLFYDLDKRKWYKQLTTFLDGEKFEPVTRTRFCGQTVYSKATDSWEFWIYGGQQVVNKTIGVDDIYVLSMPSFMYRDPGHPWGCIVCEIDLTSNSWTQVKVPQAEKIRTHTCHAIGSQLLIVGGYPPGFTVDPNAPCVSELIRVFDMNTISWKSYYDLGTVYSTPQNIIDHVGLGPGRNRDPLGKPWADPALEAAFNYTPTPIPIPPPPAPCGNCAPFPPWKIAVIVVGSLITLALIAGAVYIAKQKRGNREQDVDVDSDAPRFAVELPIGK